MGAPGACGILHETGHVWAGLAVHGFRSFCSFSTPPPIAQALKIFSKCVRVPMFDCIAIFFRTAGTAPREHGQYRQQFARA
jgi:hypothetical protein